MRSITVRLLPYSTWAKTQVLYLKAFIPSTAVRIFLTAALEHNGLPFEVKHNSLSKEMQQAIYDSRNRMNLYGPYDNAEDAVNAMLED